MGPSGSNPNSEITPSTSTNRTGRPSHSPGHSSLSFGVPLTPCVVFRLKGNLTARTLLYGGDEGFARVLKPEGNGTDRPNNGGKLRRGPPWEEGKEQKNPYHPTCARPATPLS